MNEYVKINWSRWDSTDSNFEKYAHVKSNLIYGELQQDSYDVAIMIPTFRRSMLLKEAIDSALGQVTQYRYYIAVVDNDCEVDAATDALMKDICSQHANVLYYRNEQNIGMFGNLNRCIELAAGAFCVSLHDDDFLDRRYLEKMMSFADITKTSILGSYKKVLDERCGGKISNTTRKSAPTEKLIDLFLRIKKGHLISISEKDILKGIFLPCNIYMINTKKALESGGIDDRFGAFSDAFFIVKMMMYGKVAFLPEILYTYRICVNESLKESSMRAYLHTMSGISACVACKMNISQKEKTRFFAESLVIAYESFFNTKDILGFDYCQKTYGISPCYKSPLVRKLIILKYYASWGLKMIF